MSDTINIAAISLYDFDVTSPAMIWGALPTGMLMLSYGIKIWYPNWVREQNIFFQQAQILDTITRDNALMTDEISAWNKAYYQTMVVYAAGWFLWGANQMLGNNGGFFHMLFAYAVQLFAFMPFYSLLLWRDVMTAYSTSFQKFTATNKLTFCLEIEGRVHYSGT